MESEILTVILPCAGEGSRLGLKTPKELYEIIPGTRLIDYSLNHIRAVPPGLLRVAVVIRPWKREVYYYTRDRLPGIDVVEVMFDDNYSEWPGSVYSAREYFSPCNLVLLPDSYLVTIPGDPPLLTMARAALSHHGVVFGRIACPPGQREKLKSLGAMKVEKGMVKAFQDKPRQHCHHYDGFWACYGFRDRFGKSLYDFLIQSVRHRGPDLTVQPFYPPAAFDLGGYHDLGTWENINTFKEIVPGAM